MLHGTKQEFEESKAVEICSIEPYNHRQWQRCDVMPAEYDYEPGNKVDDKARSNNHIQAKSQVRDLSSC